MVQKISIIVPAFNEAHLLPKVLHELANLQKKTSGKPYEIASIIVVNDGSTDATERVARENGATVVTLDRNYGKAFAFFKGIKKASESNPSIIVTFDADLASISVKQFEQLVVPVLTKKCKMAVGSVVDDSTVVSGQRAFAIESLEPLLNGNRKWEFYFGIRKGKFKNKVNYGLERVLNILIKSTTKAWTGFQTQREMGGKNSETAGSESSVLEQQRQGIKVHRKQDKREKLAAKLHSLRLFQRLNVGRVAKLEVYRKRLRRRIRKSSRQN